MLLLYKQQDGIDMPRGFMDDLEGEVVGEEIHEGGLENRLSFGHVGSNPTPSARKMHTYVYQDNVCFFQRNSPSAEKTSLLPKSLRDDILC